MAAVQSPAKRRFERVAVHIPASLIKEAEGWVVRRDGNTVDISLRSLRVSTDLPMEPGETVGVFLPEGLLGRYRVAWALPR